MADGPTEANEARQTNPKPARTSPNPAVNRDACVPAKPYDVSPWIDAAPRPASPTSAPETVNWPSDVAELVGWFQAIRERLPAYRFALRVGQVVVDVRGFCDALQADIDAGPEGLRARRGGLIGDLIDLRRVVEGR
jgi:hypothetical protein